MEKAKIDLKIFNLGFIKQTKVARFPFLPNKIRLELQDDQVLQTKGSHDGYCHHLSAQSASALLLFRTASIG